MLVKLTGKRVPLPAPGADKLARHIKLYGTEGVEAIRDAYSIESLPLAAFRTAASRGRDCQTRTSGSSSTSVRTARRCQRWRTRST